MFKPSFFLLTCCLTSISAFSQRNYESFSYLGLTGVVNKNTLEIEVEPKYKDVLIQSDSEMRLYSKDGSGFSYNATNKVLTKNGTGGVESAGGPAFTYNSHQSSNRFYSTKEKTFILIKGEQQNYLGIEIPDSLDLKRDIGYLELTKNNEAYLEIKYNTNKDKINFYLPKELEKKLGIKTYSFDIKFLREWFNELKNKKENEVADFIKKSQTPLELLYLGIFNDPNETIKSSSFKNDIINIMVDNGYYEAAKGFYYTFYTQNSAEFEKDEHQLLLLDAIEQSDLDFIKSIPKETLKNIKLVDEYQNRKNLLYKGLLSQNLDLIRYLVSIGLDVNKVIIDLDGKPTSASEILEIDYFNASRSKITELIKNAPRN